MNGSVFVRRHEPREVAHSCTLRVHDFAALVFCTAGSALMEQRGQATRALGEGSHQWQVHEGDVLLVPAGASHRAVSSRASMTGVQLSPASLLAEDQGHLLTPFERVRQGGSAVVHIPAPRQLFMRQLLDELERELVVAPPLSETRARDSLLTLIVNEVTRASALMPAPALQPDVVSDSLRFIEQNCLGPLGLQDVARAVHRSPAYLTTLLKRTTGQSAGQWIIAGRMAEARRRLLASDERVDVISERVGYADPTHFVRLFRRIHAATPTAFRAAHRVADGARAQGNGAIVSS